MIPFLVDMNSLFEEFVATWLKANEKELRERHGLRLTVQEQAMVYAETKSTREAVLIYPAKLDQAFDVCPNQIRKPLGVVAL